MGCATASVAPPLEASQPPRDALRSRSSSGDASRRSSSTGGSLRLCASAAATAGTPSPDALAAEAAADGVPGPGSSLLQPRAPAISIRSASSSFAARAMRRLCRRFSWRGMPGGEGMPCRALGCPTTRAGLTGARHGEGRQGASGARPPGSFFNSARICFRAACASWRFSRIAVSAARCFADPSLRGLAAALTMAGGSAPAGGCAGDASRRQLTPQLTVCTCHEEIWRPRHTMRRLRVT